MVRVRKGGRRKLDRQRFPGGKLKPLFDRGSDRTIAARERFARFHQGKADQQVFDPIGRAWCVGLLENERVDPAVLRDAGRRYAAAYWAYYEGGPATPRYDGITAATTAPKGAAHDPGGEAFQRMDRALKDAGRAAYGAVQALCVDGYHFPDEDPAWVGRLVAERLREIAGARGTTEADRRRMADAVFGLLALT